MPSKHHQKVCAYCDGPFTTRRKDRIYCSDQCRFRKWQESKDKEKAAADNTALRAIIREEVERILAERFPPSD